MSWQDRSPFSGYHWEEDNNAVALNNNANHYAIKMFGFANTTDQWMRRPPLLLSLPIRICDCGRNVLLVPCHCTALKLPVSALNGLVWLNPLFDVVQYLVFVHYSWFNSAYQPISKTRNCSTLIDVQFRVETALLYYWQSYNGVLVSLPSINSFRSTSSFIFLVNRIGMSLVLILLKCWSILLRRLTIHP